MLPFTRARPEIFITNTREFLEEIYIFICKRERQGIQVQWLDIPNMGTEINAKAYWSIAEFTINIKRRLRQVA